MLTKSPIWHLPPFHPRSNKCEFLKSFIAPTTRTVEFTNPWGQSLLTKGKLEAGWKQRSPAGAMVWYTFTAEYLPPGSGHPEAGRWEIQTLVDGTPLQTIYIDDLNPGHGYKVSGVTALAYTKGDETRVKSKEEGGANDAGISTISAQMTIQF